MNSIEDLVEFERQLVFQVKPPNITPPPQIDVVYLSPALLFN